MTAVSKRGVIRPAGDAEECKQLWQTPTPEIHTGSTFFDELSHAMRQRTTPRQGTADELAALAVLNLVVTELQGLISESAGVAGLHLNGDLAPWDELLPDGQFERLTSLRTAKALLQRKGWPG